MFPHIHLKKHNINQEIFKNNLKFSHSWIRDITFDDQNKSLKGRT